MKSEIDKLAEETETILADLREMPARWFSVNELMWIQHWSTRLRWSTGVEFETHLRDEAKELRDRKRRAAEGR